MLGLAHSDANDALLLRSMLVSASSCCKVCVQLRVHVRSWSSLANARGKSASNLVGLDRAQSLV
jgi:hypothetical protein